MGVSKFHDLFGHPIASAGAPQMGGAVLATEEAGLIMRWLSIIKASLRDWLFKDCKWVTRAQVTREICALKWKHRDHELVKRVLESLQDSI